MPDPTRTRELENRADIIARYRRFMDAPLIRTFRRSGGRVFIAVEGKPFDQILALADAGHRHFAEKFVQEAMTRCDRLRAAHPDVSIHMFGQLQRNKARKAVRLFDCIESVDRLRLAARLERLWGEDRARRIGTLLIEVNIGREPQKGGVAPDEADTLIGSARAMGLPVAGVMAIPPREARPESYFRALRRIADRHALPECFMGMSDDYALAIECGATAIRVGRAIFQDYGS